MFQSKIVFCNFAFERCLHAITKQILKNKIKKSNKQVDALFQMKADKYRKCETNFLLILIKFFLYKYIYLNEKKM